MLTEEQSDIHNFVLSKAKNISVKNPPPLFLSAVLFLSTDAAFVQ